MCQDPTISGWLLVVWDTQATSCPADASIKRVQRNKDIAQQNPSTTWVSTQKQKHTNSLIKRFRPSPPPTHFAITHAQTHSLTHSLTDSVTHSLTQLTMIAFSSTSHRFTLCPVRRRNASTKGQSLDALGSPSLSLASLQGVALRPVNTGIAALRMSQLRWFWMLPESVDRSLGVRPEPNCGRERERVSFKENTLVLKKDRENDECGMRQALSPPSHCNTLCGLSSSSYDKPTHKTHQ